MNQFVIDRFEENFAVLENEAGETVDVDKSLLLNAKEGDVVVLENNLYRVDKALTQERHRMIQEKMKRLFNRG